MTFICVCVYTYICTHTHMHTYCMCIYRHTRINTQTHTCTEMNPSLFKCMRFENCYKCRILSHEKAILLTHSNLTLGGKTEGNIRFLWPEIMNKSIK